MLNYTFQDFRDRISIIEIAQKIGYKLNRQAGLRKPEYHFYLNGVKIDEIVIYNPDNSSIQTFFSRGMGDHGNLIFFVMNRLQYFAHTSDGYEGVNEVLHDYLGAPRERYQADTSLFCKKDAFIIEDYEVIGEKHSTLNYLYVQRRISVKTITDFMKINAVMAVKRKNGSIWNVGFPYVIPGHRDIVNFELRNSGTNGKSYKSFCTGGIKSTACWIASFFPYNEVRRLYIGESAIDLMSVYELLNLNVDCQCAFVSTGGNLVKTQIDKLKKLFPNAEVNWCNDNDVQGRIFNILGALYYRGIEAKGYRDKASETVSLEIEGQKYTFQEAQFSDRLMLAELKIPDLIMTPEGAKDFNEQLWNKKSITNLLME